MNLAIRRFAWKGGVWAGLSFVTLFISILRDHVPHDISGALNWATGETVAVKEIQLSNIPKAELGEIMVIGVNNLTI